MSDSNAPPAAPFDDHVLGYDEIATSELGVALRSRVHHVLTRFLGANNTVIDLGCGTGIDAEWLSSRVDHVYAYDASSAMVQAAQDRCGALSNVTIAAGDIAGLAVAEPVDLLLANFGVVNCAPELGSLRSTLARCLVPGGHAVLVTMPRWCPIELGIGAATANRCLLTRRRPGSDPGPGYEGLEMRYVSAGGLAAILAPDFELAHAESLGLVLPPFEQRGWIEHRPRLRTTLVALDRRLGRLGAQAGVGDHHIAVFKRSFP